MAVETKESLFFRLFHAGSAERDRLEDFLTEILADLLNRLPHDRQLAVCDEFLLSRCKSSYKQSWLDRARRSYNLMWETQELISIAGVTHPKRPDIVLYGSDYNDKRMPLMVIENKIGAHFTIGTIHGVDGDKIVLNQLALYDRWLSDESGPLTSIVLLTHFIDPPHNFLEESGPYRAFVRATRRWAELYDWLTTQHGIDFWDPDAKLLVGSLVDFLREKQLMSEKPTISDLAAARIYLCGGSHQRTVGAMKAARKAVLTKFSSLNLKKFPNDAPKIYSTISSGWLSDWCQRDSDPYIGWGIFFVQEEDDEWDGYEPPITLHQGVYINIDFPMTVKRPSGSSFDGWHFPTSDHEEGQPFEVYSVASLGDMTGDFSEAFCKWVVNRFDDALKLIVATSVGS